MAPREYLFNPPLPPSRISYCSSRLFDTRETMFALRLPSSVQNDGILVSTWPSLDLPLFPWMLKCPRVYCHLPFKSPSMLSNLPVPAISEIHWFSVSLRVTIVKCSLPCAEIIVQRNQILCVPKYFSSHPYISQPHHTTSFIQSAFIVSQDGVTPLMLAISRKDRPMVDALLDEGADVNANSVVCGIVASSYCYMCIVHLHHLPSMFRRTRPLY